MMRSRLLALRERQVRLAARAQTERENLQGYVAQADAVLAWVTRGRQAVDEAKRHPLLLAAGALLLFALRPRRLLRLLASGWSAWQLYRRVRRWWLTQAPGALRSATRSS
jgi:hypothetical protein